MNGVGDPPSIIETDNFKFVIFDAPNDDNVELYIRELRRLGVQHVVRACESTYDASRMTEAGISVTDVVFKDGNFPPKSVVKSWLKTVTSIKNQGSNTIGVHCVAGLGRAPVLVAICLIEEGMDPLEVVPLIRRYRRGAINTAQLQGLRSYKAKGGCDLM